MSDHISAVTLDEAIGASEWLSDQFASRLGESGHVSLKGVMALAQFSISLEHREAALALVRIGARSSAMALSRSTLESYVLGLWCQAVAPISELERIRKSQRTKFPTFETAFQAVKKRHPFKNRIEPLRLNYSTLCDYSHGQMRQVSRWIGADGINPRHSDAEMIECLKFSDSLGTLACMAREDVLSRDVAPFATLHNLVLSGRYYQPERRMDIDAQIVALRSSFAERPSSSEHHSGDT